MTNAHLRIVRRAFSEYTEIASFKGGYLDALGFASAMQLANRDGEYLVYNLEQPYWAPVPYGQSGFDWI